MCICQSQSFRLSLLLFPGVCVCVCVHAPSRSVVSAFVTPWTVAHQAALSLKFSRQQYWRGWPFPSPGNLPDPGIKPGSPTS